MINAKTLRDRMPTACALPAGFITLDEVVENILPMIEKEACEMASMGGRKILIKRDEMMKYTSGDNFNTKKEIMDAVSKALKKAGFKIEIPTSYTSIHIAW